MGSLAPAKRLAAAQTLSDLIPASVKREKQNTLPCCPLTGKLLLAINLYIKRLNTLRLSILPVQALPF